MAWQEKKPESSRTVGKIYRWFEKKWLIEQHAEKINQQLFCVVQEKLYKLFYLTVVNRYCMLYSSIHMHSKPSKIVRLIKLATLRLRKQAISSACVERSWSITYSCCFSLGALFPVTRKFAKHLTVGWNFPYKMVPPAASKIFQLLLKIIQVAEVCVEEIKVQTLLVNPAVFSLMPHNKIWVVCLFNLLFNNIENCIFFTYMIIMIFFYRTSFKVQEREDSINEQIFWMPFSYHSMCSPHFIYCTQFKLCPQDRLIHSLKVFSVQYSFQKHEGMYFHKPWHHEEYYTTILYGELRNQTYDNVWGCLTSCHLLAQPS